MRRATARRLRRGYVLVTYAMLFFGLMALAGLVIDLGMARVAQRQMQSAVDTAAVEGLRSRDATGEPGRALASNVTAWAFDDDLNPGNGDPRQFGTGPVIGFEGGNESGIDPDGLNAAQTLSRPTLAYKPQRSDGTPGLELNATNEPHGDLVAGRFLPDGTPGESSTYARGDFDPTAAAADRDAFLVRMRRTNDFQGLDNGGGISSSGPTLPFLFARGSTIRKVQEGDPDAPPNPNDYNPRTDGITVRATAVAQVVPAMTVGPPDPTVPLEGLAAVALLRSYWTDRMTVGQESVFQVGSDGSLTDTGGNLAGRLYTINGPVSVGRRFRPTGATTTEAGDLTYTPPAGGGGISADPTAAFAALYDPSGGQNWVVGFGVVTVASASATEVQIVRRDGGTAFPATHPFRPGQPLRNVSAAVLQGGNNVLRADAAWADVLAGYAALKPTAGGARPGSARAPALVR